MKKLVPFVILLLASIYLEAQTPEKLSYQAIIRNSSDAILANQSIGIQISILQTSAVGSSVYVETQNPTTNENGLITIEIGNGSIVSGTFSTIDWAANTYFIKTEIDPTGGSAYSITSTSQLMSVPYALHAKTADNFTGTITETDPEFIASDAYSISASDITNWDAKQDVIGDGDLTIARTSGLQTALDAKLETEVDGSITNEIQNLEDVLTESNDANAKSIVNVNQIAVGTDTPNTSAAIDINSTTGALLLPRLDETQRDALTPAEGMVVYNTDEKKFQGYIGATSSIDQSQESQNQSFDNSNTAQSFTAGASGELTQVDVYLFGDDSNVTITIRDGAGTSGSILFTEAMPTITGSLTWYSVSISGVNLVAGNPYTIHLTSTSFDVFMWGRDNTNPYNGGTSYYSNTAYSTYDLCFRTYSSGSGSWVDLH